MDRIYSIFDNNNRTYDNRYRLLESLPITSDNFYNNRISIPVTYDTDVNSYCVPTFERVVLYFYDENHMKELFDARSSDSIEILRRLEEKRNEYIEYKQSRGVKVTESIVVGRNFDLYRNIELGWVKYIDAECNFDISESFRQLIDEIGLDDTEEFNYRYINWVNNHIDKLSVLGFYGSNFPDIVLFDYEKATSYDINSIDIKKYEYTTADGNIVDWPIVRYRVYPIIDEESIRFKASEFRYNIRDTIKGKINSFLDIVIPNKKVRKGIFIGVVVLTLIIFREFIIGGLILIGAFIILKKLFGF